VEIEIQCASVQTGKKLTKIIGLLSAKSLAAMMDGITLRPNPRSPNVNKITKAITHTLESDPELLQYKTKGVLAAGKLVSNSGCHFDIDFSTPSYGGILDGGHNFLAIVRVMLIEAVRHKYPTLKKEDKRIRKEVEKIRSLRDLMDRWKTYGLIVKEMIDALEGLPANAKKQDKLFRKMSFLLPVEVIVPCHGTTDNEVREIIHEISVARNNNVQLKEVAIAQHKGSYELLKHILPDEINSRVQWKCGENQCPIAPTKIVPLALLPLKKLEEAGVLGRLAVAIHANNDADADAEETAFPPVKLMSMYTSTAGCISIYSQVIDAVANLNEFGGDDELLGSVLDSLAVIQDLPRVWDELECQFEELFSAAVSGNEKKYAELSCNSKGPVKTETPTRFYTKQIPKGKFVSRAGFVTPLFMSMCSAFLAYDVEEQKVKWLVSPDRIIAEIAMPSKQCKAMMHDYVSLIKTVDYDPSKFGKAPMPYEALNNYGSFIAWVNYVKRT